MSVLVLLMSFSISYHIRLSKKYWFHKLFFFTLNGWSFTKFTLLFSGQSKSGITTKSFNRESYISFYSFIICSHFEVSFGKYPIRIFHTNGLRPFISDGIPLKLKLRSIAISIDLLFIVFKKFTTDSLVFPFYANIYESFIFWIISAII